MERKRRRRKEGGGEEEEGKRRGGGGSVRVEDKPRRQTDRTGPDRTGKKDNKRGPRHAEEYYFIYRCCS